MGTVYKIHPAIGVARVGNHQSKFFIGPESPGAAGLDFLEDGTEAPITRYKEGGKIKRQATRFRIFRFEQDDVGNLQLIGEVTSDNAKIEWTVNLVNSKAALDKNRIAAHVPQGVDHPARPRNKSVADRNSLIIKNPQPVTISGKSQAPKPFNGTFLGTSVYLGELQTDTKGRLIVLGGRGTSKSVPEGAKLSSFANNDKWHDDVSDGPVTAVVTLPNQAPVVVHHPSWVVVAPPDFAPRIDAIVTLYDVAFDAAVKKGALKPADIPSFSQHIRPLIERAAALRWVNNFERWQDLASPAWNALASTAAANASLRSDVATRIRDPGLSNFVFPDFLEFYLSKWEAGSFISDIGAPDPQVLLPDQLDRAALGACVGNNFYPGIEASLQMKDKDIYARPFRLDHTNLGKVYPGCLTEIMALPWQADFSLCDGGVWWPSQRPDIAMTDANNIPGSKAPHWEAPIAEGDFKGMVDNVQRLGFVVPQQVGNQMVFVEQDRDPEFPRAALVAMAGDGNAPPTQPG